LASLFVMYGLLAQRMRAARVRAIASARWSRACCFARPTRPISELHAPASISFEHAWFLLLRHGTALGAARRSRNGGSVPAADRAADPPGSKRPSPTAASFEDLRLIAAQLPAEEAGLLAYARAMVSWRRQHRFCGCCGAQTTPAKGGHVLICSNPACGKEQFPRIDPAIIVLVSDGDRALLGRQAAWPPGRYSTIAGFVEPGESLEDAVAREVLEETGIAVDDIEYHSSQPWPFPASLMLGFTAHALSREILRLDQELEDARWFSRADLASGSVLLPPRQSISYRLIEHWYDAGGAHCLRDIRGATSWQASR
jgi:NAD+ diphosphatase